MARRKPNGEEFTVQEAMNYLIDKLIMYGGSELGHIFLDGYIKEYGEVPDEYKDAVKALMEDYGKPKGGQHGKDNL